MTDADYLDRLVRLRDNDAFTRLVHRYERLVYGVCFGQLRNHTDAEDAAQQVFLKLYLGAEGIRYDLGGWLRACASNTSISIARSRSAARRREAFVSDRCEDAIPPVELDEVRRVVRDCLARLDRRDRELIERHLMAGESQAVIAGEWGVSQQAVSKHVTRVKQSLAAHLIRRGIAVIAAAVCGCWPMRSASAALARLHAIDPTWNAAKLTAAGVLAVGTVIGPVTNSPAASLAYAELPRSSAPFDDAWRDGPAADPARRPGRSAGSTPGVRIADQRPRRSTSPLLLSNLLGAGLFSPNPRTRAPKPIHDSPDRAAESAPDRPVHQPQPPKSNRPLPRDRFFPPPPVTGRPPRPGRDHREKERGGILDELRDRIFRWISQDDGRFTIGYAPINSIDWATADGQAGAFVNGGRNFPHAAMPIVVHSLQGEIPNHAFTTPSHATYAVTMQHFQIGSFSPRQIISLSPGDPLHGEFEGAVVFDPTGTINGMPVLPATGFPPDPTTIIVTPATGVGVFPPFVISLPGLPIATGLGVPALDGLLEVPTILDGNTPLAPIQLPPPVATPLDSISHGSNGPVTAPNGSGTIPEPATILFLGSAAGLALARRRRSPSQET